ncbi:chromosome segregation protein SMC [Thioclava sp. BHET1]|nr:chromosome segregation protein SMC [Thioclava sp. BHET1]
MRLEQLDLTRYGRFTDTSLEFPAPTDGHPDIHVIFGPNEAGKSTLFAAWLDLLFGVPHKTRYDFLHAGPTIEIGARINHAGAELDVVRRKGRGSTLFDRDGSALPDSSLLAALGGLTREGYSAMFSLDDETIEEGGDAILSSGGELGQLLFSASAGLSGLTAQLEAFEGELDSFHRKGKRSGTLYEGKKKLDELIKSARALDTSVAEQKRRSRELEIAQKDWRDAKAHESELRRRLERVNAALNALPLEGMLAAAKDELAKLGSLPEAGKDALEKLQRLELEKARLSESKASLSRQMGEIADQLDALQPDPAALDQVDAIRAAEDLRAEHDSAIKDLPRRQQELSELSHSIEQLLTDLGHPDAKPADLVLLPGQLAQLRNLLSHRSGLVMAASRAKEEFRKAERLLQTEQERLGEDGQVLDVETGNGLAALLSRLHASDPAFKRRQAAENHGVARQKLQGALEALAPWHGDAEQLAALSVPAQWKIDAWREQLDKTQEAEKDALKTLEQTKERLEGLQREIETAPETVLGFTLEDAALARSRREELWAAHLGDMTPASAKTFEAALREDDQFTALMGEAIARKQRFDAAQIDLRKAAEAEDKARTAYNVAKQMAEQTVAEVEAACATLGLSGATFFDLERWLKLRLDALAQLGTFRAATDDLTRAADDMGQAAASLAHVMGKPEPSGPSAYEALWAEAEALHRNAEKRQETRATLARLRRDLNDRRAEDQSANKELEDWQAGWCAAVEGSLLEHLPWDSAGLGTTLELLDALATRLRDHDGLSHRVVAMEQNRDRFLAAKLGVLAALEMPEISSWSEVLARKDKAVTAQADRGKLEEQRKKLKGFLHEADRDLDDQLRALDALGLTLDWPADGPRSLREHIEACAEATRLRTEIRRLSAELEKQPAEDDDTSRDEAGLNELADQLAVMVEEARHDVERLHGLASDAQHALDQIGSDDALAKNASERENLRLLLKEQAKDHLSRKFGLIALEMALRRYRAEHQSAMLATASQAFEKLSCGAYPSLSVLPQGHSDRLVAVSNSGSTRLATDMSKGTRFQLYLALRVAGYHEIAKTRASVPFIADDIMETFDDERAAAAFSLLGEMSRFGQVIYLTHHRHLCEIAQATCPGARLIDLQSL